MIFQCDKCGLRQRIEEDEFPMACVCGKRHTLTPPMPGLPGRLVRYAKAVTGHWAGGSATRPDREVQRILSEYCRKPCRYFDGQTCRHGKCGCRVNGSASALTNKIRMASQSCPIGLWGPDSRPAGITRIVLVTPELMLGGAERWVSWMTRCCDPDAVRVEAVVSATGKDRTDRRLAAEIRTTCPLYFDGEAPLILSKSADMVLTWGLKRIPKSMARFRGPVVFVGHGATEKDRKIAEAAAENGATHFAAVSQAAAEFLPDGVRHDVIHNGVDLSRCLPVRGRKAVRASWGVEDDDVCVGFVGRPHPEKHPDLVVEACSLLPDRHRPVFVGDVQPHDQRRLSSLGRQPIFSGRVDQIGDALAGLDCMMLPSEHEAMSLSVVEAWAAGVPVVATPVGAIPELEDRHGALVEQIPVGCSAKEASAAIMRATAVQHRPVADRACRLAREEFSLEAMGRRWTTYLLAVRAARSDLDQSPVTIHHEPSTLRKRRWTMDAKRFSDAAAMAAKIVRGSAANVMSRVTSRKSVARPEPVEDPAESKIGTRIVQGDADPEAVEAPPRRAGIAAAASRWWLGNGEPAAKEPKTISVAVVTPTLQSAGAERWAVSLAKSIQGDGIECAGLLVLNPSHAADPSMSARARESCRLLTMEDDILSVREADAIVMWGYAKLPKEFGEYRGMLVYASHSSTPEGGQIALEASKHVHHLVAVSKKCAEHIPPQCSCTIIHNGVDLARCEPRVSRLDMRKWWGAGQDDILVAYVGRWHADKHLEKVGEACRELGEFYRPAYVGSMTLREECRLAKVNPRSVFAGYVPHIGDALGAVDVVCLLSDHEAMSLTLCEAWAAGVPVVCTAVGAVPELQEMFGEVAKLVESKLNVKTIAGQIETALSPHSRPIVVRAREMARTYCSEEAMSRRWRAFIRRCMLERDSDG